MQKRSESVTNFETPCADEILADLLLFETELEALLRPRKSAREVTTSGLDSLDFGPNPDAVARIAGGNRTACFSIPIHVKSMPPRRRVDAVIELTTVPTPPRFATPRSNSHRTCQRLRSANQKSPLLGMRLHPATVMTYHNAARRPRSPVSGETQHRIAIVNRAVMSDEKAVAEDA